jgi:hypothetical protein
MRFSDTIKQYKWDKTVLRHCCWCKQKSLFCSKWHSGHSTAYISIVCMAWLYSSRDRNHSCIRNRLHVNVKFDREKYIVMMGNEFNRLRIGSLVKGLYVRWLTVRYHKRIRPLQHGACWCSGNVLEVFHDFPQFAVECWNSTLKYAMNIAFQMLTFLTINGTGLTVTEQKQKSLFLMWVHKFCVTPELIVQTIPNYTQSGKCSPLCFVKCTL